LAGGICRSHLSLAITAGERSPELAINELFETPGLAHQIRLIKRVLNDRRS
jgi:hypothetical protein